MTAAELRTRRDQVRNDLEATHRHLVTVLRDPEPELRSAPLGDVLCWCEGLDEEKVTRILEASEIVWGKQLSKLTNRDIAMVCFQVKARHPETWERWKLVATGRAAA